MRREVLCGNIFCKFEGVGVCVVEVEEWSKRFFFVVVDLVGFTSLRFGSENFGVGLALVGMDGLPCSFARPPPF